MARTHKDIRKDFPADAPYLSRAERDRRARARRAVLDRHQEIERHGRAASWGDVIRAVNKEGGR